MNSKQLPTLGDPVSGTGTSTMRTGVGGESLIFWKQRGIQVDFDTAHQRIDPLLELGIDRQDFLKCQGVKLPSGDYLSKTRQDISDV